MSRVTEWVQASGEWSLRLKPDTPQEIRDALAEWSHISVFDQEVDLDEYTDADLKALARWSGVVLDLPDDLERPSIGGVGMAVHLGDPKNIGDLFESEVNIASDTFADSIRAVLPAGGSIVEGTFGSATGTLTADLQWLTPRAAVDYVCGIFSSVNGERCEWRVNPDGTMDAGLISTLYTDDPASETTPPLLVRRGGEDLNVDATSVKRFSGRAYGNERLTRAVVTTRNDASEVVIGSADEAGHGLKDFHGNALVRTRLRDEALTSEDNADDRATFLLEEDNAAREEYEAVLDDLWAVQGSFSLGDWVLAYDRVQGLYDESVEVPFGGDYLNARSIRVAGWRWSISDGMGIGHRDKDGTWTNLTQYVEFASDPTTLYLGDKPPSSFEALPDIASSIESTEPPDAVPEPCTTLVLTSEVYPNKRGKPKGRIDATWVLPTQNTDGSTLTVLDRVTVSWRINGSGNEWEKFNTEGDETAAVIERLDPEETYEVRVRPSQGGGRVGTWITDTEDIEASGDDIDPSKPSVPTVESAGANAIRVEHDLLKNGGGSLEGDVRRLLIFVDTSSGVTAIAANRAGYISVDKAAIDDGQALDRVVRARGANGAKVPFDSGTSYYVGIVAVDAAGNQSDISTTAGPVTAGEADVIVNRAMAPDSVSTGNIQADAITAGKIDVTNLSAVNIDTGDLTVTGDLIIDAVAGGSFQVDASAGFGGVWVWKWENANWTRMYIEATPGGTEQAELYWTSDPAGDSGLTIREFTGAASFGVIIDGSKHVKLRVAGTDRFTVSDTGLTTDVPLTVDDGVGVVVHNAVANANDAHLTMQKARAADTRVLENDQTGSLEWEAHDGTDFQPTARLRGRASVEGSAVNGDPLSGSLEVAVADDSGALLNILTLVPQEVESLKVGDYNEHSGSVAYTASSWAWLVDTDMGLTTIVDLDYRIKWKATIRIENFAEGEYVEAYFGLYNYDGTDDKIGDLTLRHEAGTWSASSSTITSHDHGTGIPAGPWTPSITVSVGTRDITLTMEEVWEWTATADPASGGPKARLRFRSGDDQTLTDVTYHAEIECLGFAG